MRCHLEAADIGRTECSFCLRDAEDSGRRGPRRSLLTRYNGCMQIREEPIGQLARQAEISIAFEVKEVFALDLVDGGLGGLRLYAQPVDVPWVKDYDSTGGNPSRWASHFDVSNWGLLGAYADGRRVGGAVIAFDTPGVHMLRGRHDLAVLWDLRVAPENRWSGVGTELFEAAVDWAQNRGCTALEVETQQVNVPACRFYASMGCSLATLDRFAYAELPDEVQLIWRQTLSKRPE